MRSGYKRLIFTAVFIALIFITTAYILHIPAGNGYIHIGDSLIYLAASCLPAPFAMAAAALGAGLSDALTGFPQYILFTIIIKPLNALCFTGKGAKLLTKRNIVAPFASALITIAGYYLADVFLYGNWVSPLATIPQSLIQAGGSLAVYLILAFALDKLDFKRRILGEL